MADHEGTPVSDENFAGEATPPSTPQARGAFDWLRESHQQLASSSPAPTDEPAAASTNPLLTGMPGQQSTPTPPIGQPAPAPSVAQSPSGPTLAAPISAPSFSQPVFAAPVLPAPPSEPQLLPRP